LYVFSLKKSDEDTKEYLKFICGYINSAISTFYAQSMEIIRYRKGKQPQIKISDLYSLPVPTDRNLVKNISGLVDDIYRGKRAKAEAEREIDALLGVFFELTTEENEYLEKSISSYLKS
jgi:hypothetical protein